MGSSTFSPYAVPESEPPKWKPGELQAASAFIGCVFYLVFDINICILRLFKRKKGVYFWSLFLGSWGCLIDAIGVILKFLVPVVGRAWPSYTILLLIGWSTYAPAQLFVLYSRLHLVNDNPKILRILLIMISSTLLTLVLPTWIVFWPAYDPDPRISSVWSPRDAIVERYTQIGFTLVEMIVSGIYIWSLLHLMNHKPSVRQRRVMLDLIYVNVIVLSFDIVMVIFVYLNQTGISHPLQTFSYILKLKLEFVVLNQLMSVAARGLRKQSYEDRRYRHPSLNDLSSVVVRPKRPSFEITTKSTVITEKNESLAQSSLSHRCPPGMARTTSLPEDVRSDGSDWARRRVTGSDGAAGRSFLDIGPEPEIDYPAPTRGHIPSPSSSITKRRHDDQDNTQQTFLGDTSAPSVDGSPPEASLPLSQGQPPHPDNNGNEGRNTSKFRFFHQPLFRKTQDTENEAGQASNRQRHQQISNWIQPPNAPQGGDVLRGPRKANLKVKKLNANSDEEDEIPVHLWERNGTELVLEAPWLQSRYHPSAGA